MTNSRVFLTGGSGFIGRSVLGRLAATVGSTVLALHRGDGLPVHANVESVRGDLKLPASYSDALADCGVVLHLAGLTGKAAPQDYFTVNVEGTKTLLEACRKAGVGRFIFVSSIAATYRDKAAYYYAQSKELAEQAVRESGVNYLIVRPTLVLGPASPIWQKLRSLALLPVMPVIGDGLARVQPIYVDDVATFLASVTDESTLPDRAVDLGGADVVTFEVLLRKIRRACIGRESPVVHVPARAIMALLTRAEAITNRLPVSAGQFCAFVNDGVADHDPFVAARVPEMISIDDMLHRLTVRG